MKDLKKLKYYLVGNLFDLEMVNFYLEKYGYSKIQLDSITLNILKQYSIINTKELIITTAWGEYEGEIYFTIINIVEK